MGSSLKKKECLAEFLLQMVGEERDVSVWRVVGSEG